MDLKLLNDAITDNDIEKVKVILSSGNVKINDIDETGMTPLQHACYKAHLELIDYLLAMGADVNSDSHPMGYTSLMFAALSGKEQVVVKLLNVGAKVDCVNSVGRTASQMAAFIGNHRVATIINNYIERCEIFHFTKPDGIKKQVRLKPALVGPLHHLVNQINFSPVKMVLLLRRNNLLNECKSFALVMQQLSRKNFDPHDTNESMSIKYFCMAFVCRRIDQAYEEGDLDLSKLLRMLLQGIPPYGLAEGQEKLLREALKEFPHLESQLYRIIIRELYKVPIGHHPSAMEVLNNRINGQVFFCSSDRAQECATCYSSGYSDEMLGAGGGGTSRSNKMTTTSTNGWGTNGTKLCSKCSAVAYCNTECQRLHWFTHKKFCDRLRDAKHEQIKPNGDNVIIDDKEEQSDSNQSQKTCQEECPDVEDDASGDLRTKAPISDEELTHQIDAMTV